MLIIDEFTSEQFNDLCNICKNKCLEEFGDNSLYNMEMLLKRDFGFKSIKIEAFYEFHEI